MAYDITLQAPYSGRPDHVLQLYVRRDQTDTPNNRSSYAWEIRAIRTGSWQGSYNNGQYPWSVSVAGQGFSGTASLPFSASVGNIGLASGTTGWVNHAPDGTLDIQVGASHGPAGQFGTASIPLTWFTTDPTRRPPAAPGAPGLSVPTHTSFRVTAGTPANNGSPITQYGYQWDTDPAFPNPGTFQYSGNVADILNRLPITKYYVRTNAANAAGWGPFGPAASISTLAGIYESDGSAWHPMIVYASDGVAWSQQALFIDPDGTQWVTPV